MKNGTTDASLKRRSLTSTINETTSQQNGNGTHSSSENEDGDDEDEDDGVSDDPVSKEENLQNVDVFR